MKARQMEKTVNGASSIAYFAGSEVMGDYDSAGTLQNRYVAGVFGEPGLQISSAGAKSYFHAEGDGSIIALSDAAGAVTDRYSYSPFGESDPLAGTPFGFGGARYEPTTEKYISSFGTAYDPGVGRMSQMMTGPSGDMNPNGGSGTSATNHHSSRESGMIDMNKTVLSLSSHFFDAFNDITNTDIHKMMNSLGSPTKLDDQGGGSGLDRWQKEALIHDINEWLQESGIREGLSMAADIAEAIEGVLDAVTIAAAIKKVIGGQLIKYATTRIDWNKYPQVPGVPMLDPNLLKKLDPADYAQNRALADAANKKLNKEIGNIFGMDGEKMQWHELLPVEFGGDPESFTNKVLISATDHRKLNAFFNHVRGVINRSGN